MTESSEKRRDPRTPLVLRVDWPGVPLALRDVTENVSARGLFVRTDRPLAAGSRLPLVVGFPGLLDPVEIEVEVVRRRLDGPEGPAGVAVVIPADRTDDLRRLEALALAARDGGGSTRTYRLLVVEDDPLAVETYGHALRGLKGRGGGLDVALEYAGNAAAAFERLCGEPPIDLVLADLYLPVLEGFALVERMRADARTARVPVLAIADGDEEARARATALGVDVFLEKPVRFADVVQTVRTLLRAERPLER
jgi:CheY-like chemotaxis protein